MELIDVIRWISIILMWGATALNVYALIRGNQNYKALIKTRERYEETIKRYEEAIDELHKEAEGYRKRCLDEGSDNDYD